MEQIVFLIVLSVTLVLSKDCLLHDQCSCGFDDGSGSVDLTSLGNKDNTPRFKDVYYDTDQTYYSYNPCGGFTEGDCSNAAACALSSDKTQTQQIGDASLSKTAFKFDESSGNVQVSYTAGSGVISLTEVILVCDPNAGDPVFEPQGEIQQGNFLMQLTTVCACPNKCDSSGPHRKKASGGIGGGSVLLIVFFSLLLVYIVAGALFMKFVKKAEGREIIPNVTFWAALPGLIKGGFVFVVSKHS